jgi:hypothetical protein
MLGYVLRKWIQTNVLTGSYVKQFKGSALIGKLNILWRSQMNTK